MQKRVDLREIDKKKLAPKAKENLQRIQAALPDAEVIPVQKGVVKRITEAEEDYHDQESEWEDDEVEVQTEDAGHRIFKDFSGGEKGTSGITDLTPEQAVLLTEFRVLAASYPQGYFSFDTFPEWFEIYRLSINRGSRKETVEMFRGKLEVGPKTEEDGIRSPNRF